MVDNLSSTFIDSISGVLVFKLGVLEFCLDIKTVISTIDIQETNALTNRNYLNAKHIEYDNEIIPLINIHTIYGLKSHYNNINSRILLLDHNNKKIAFIVDNIKEIISINKKTRDSLKYISLKNKPYLNGKLIYDDQVILCPDLEKITRDQKSYRVNSVGSRIDSENEEELF